MSNPLGPTKVARELTLDLLRVTRLITTTADITNLNRPGAPASNDNISYQKHLPYGLFGYDLGGIWTVTRGSAHEWYIQKSAGSGTAVMTVDITEHSRTVPLNNKGFRLDSIDIAYRINTQDISSFTPSLKIRGFSNLASVSIASEALTDVSTLPTTINSGVRYVTRSLTSPVFTLDPDKNYVLEMTLVPGSGTIFDFYGVGLNFTRNDVAPS